VLNKTLNNTKNGLIYVLKWLCLGNFKFSIPDIPYLASHLDHDTVQQYKREKLLLPFEYLITASHK
jgi:hypothetical protein